MEMKEQEQGHGKTVQVGAIGLGQSDELVDLIPKLDCSRTTSTILKSSAIFKLGHCISVGVESINGSKAKASKALKEADAAKAEASEAKAEVEHLKEALKKAEKTLAKTKINMASKIEKRKRAEVKIEEVQRDGEKRVVETKLTAMEEFKIFEELRNIKVQFAREAYDVGFNTCR
ncbi:hypothetical protein COCNU_scaffold004989G000010 [Cocos nucifera]|nr:hypothetical protein [Cocos nucifera]